jgi:hypothetical protein
MELFENIKQREKLALAFLLIGFTISGAFLVYGYSPLLIYLKAYNFGIVTVLVYSLLEDEGTVGTDIFQ